MDNEELIEALEQDINELVNDIKKRDAEITRLRAENEALLAYGRLAYRAVKFAEHIQPQGLHDLLESAPPPVRGGGVE